jgi:hypothetical protein
MRILCRHDPIAGVVDQSVQASIKIFGDRYFLRISMKKKQ